ncbi:MAG: SAM-dependent methyltransferase [Sneathiella sp.]|jgi:hypothetical protein|uniref:DUF938 domain-containing protein n=1 Tax=Sneathiella sp. TaxID=1964365 RepID=UPI000C6A1F2A|nr:DUF938 domain-containing protein [Sneathiella sp.]MAL79463.1 SAM-dependent methyltransferase [Sneathiella sp.]
MTDRRQFAPAAERNREPILRVLKDWLPQQGTVLEVASGSGEHAIYFAPRLTPLLWQSSNYEQEQMDSVSDWIAHAPADNLLPPLWLDVTEAQWPVEEEAYEDKPVTAIFNANMIHISPWATTAGLMAGAGRILPAGGRLILYGPFKINGEHTANSNREFDGWLKARDAGYGVRDIRDVITEARKNGLQHLVARPMPANNFMHLFEKA